MRLILPPTSDADVEAILARVARRVLAALGDTDDSHADDSHADDGLDAWTADVGAALQPTLPRLATDDPPPRPPRPRTATAGGFSLHADTAVHAADRRGLERLLRYGLRPAFAHDRLELTAARTTLRATSRSSARSRAR